MIRALLLLLALASFPALGQTPANRVGIIQPSANITGTVTSNDVLNDAFRGIHVAVNVTVFGTGTLIPKVQGWDQASQTYYDILVGTAISGTGMTVLKVYPGIGTVSGGAANDLLPAIWRVVLTKSDSSVWRYSVGYNADF